MVDYHPFPDHHEYTSADLRAIEETARRVGAKYILTTEKDAVKLNPNSFSLPAYKVSLDMEILEGREVFNRHVLN